MRKHNFAAICGVIIIAAATVSAKQQGVATLMTRTPRVNSLKFSEPWRPNGASSSTRIIGTVIDIRQVPVAHARVQVRNLVTGNLDQVGESNENGEYAFELDASGTFLVEMVLVDGYVISLSNAGSVSRYQTLQTVIQLPGRWDSTVRSMIAQQSYTGFLGLSAINSMTNATLRIAAYENIATADSGEPVSP